jgi:hypothetical protein
MSMEHRAAVEMNELVLSPSLDAGDALAFELQRSFVRKLPSERWMQGPDGGDSLAFNCSSKASHRFLNFG